MSESADIAITTVNFILIITCIVGNCFVCAVVMRNRDMRIPINYLLVNLAVGDIMYSTFMIPNIILSHNINHPEGVTGKVLCALITGRNFAWIGAFASVFTLIAIGIERYFVVLYPHGNKGKLTTRKLKVIIPISWIVGLIVQLPGSLTKNFVKKRKTCVLALPESWMLQAYWKMCYVYISLSCILLVVLYSRVVYTLWFKRYDDNTITHQQQGVMKVRKKVTLMVVTISAIFVICWGTDILLHILDNEVDSIKLGPYVFPIVHTMVMFNSAVNPYAYALINQRFREKMKRMICCNSSSFEKGVYTAPEREPQDIEMGNNIGTQSSNTAETTSTE